MKKISSLEDLTGTIRGFQQARIIQAGVMLSIFDYTKKSRTAEELAREAGLSLRGTRILLDALASMGLLEKKGAKYTASSIAKEYLAKDSPSMFHFSVLHGERLYRKWEHLPDAVREGHLPVEAEEAFPWDEEHTRLFTRSMAGFAFQRVEAMVDAVDLEGVERIMDVGGGPGVYLGFMLKKRPGARGILLDKADVLREAKGILERIGVADRVDLVEKDILEGDEPYAGDVDLAILSNIIHIFSEKENLGILRRIYDSLKHGGRLLVQDFLPLARLGR